MRFDDLIKRPAKPQRPQTYTESLQAAKRRKSFCARMGGVKGPMKKPNGKPTRKALALCK